LLDREGLVDVSCKEAMSVFSEGENFRIVLRNGVAIWTVWRRPDLDMAAGAALAERQVGEATRLLVRGVRGMVFDLTEAPDIAGPKTQEAIGNILAPFEKMRVPVTVVVVSPMQVLQLNRLVSEHAPTMGAVCSSVLEAEDGLGARAPMH